MTQRRLPELREPMLVLELPIEGSSFEKMAKPPIPELPAWFGDDLCPLTGLRDGAATRKVR